MPLVDFFLEAMKDVNDRLKPQSINGAIGASIVILDKFKDATSTETFERLRRIGLEPALHLVKCMTKRATDILRKS